MADLDVELLKAELQTLKPVTEYISYLARGERSDLLGLSVDGRGRLDLDAMPPFGRYLVAGAIWVTTTEVGEAWETAQRRGETTFKLRPIVEGGLELAIFEDHALILCSAGASLMGPLGRDGRLPAAAFRLDLDDLDSVRIALKNKLFGGVKETSFTALRQRGPMFVVTGEAIARIDEVPTYEGSVAGSKPSKGEAGQQMAVAAAKQRLAGDVGSHRGTLEAIVAGSWPTEDGGHLAELTEDDDPDAVSGRDPEPRTP